MVDFLKTSIVRIRDNNSNIVGTGFLIGEQHILTCAHVIRDALGMSMTPNDPPDENVVLDFPFSGFEQLFSARVVYWNPRQHDYSGDIAGLVLNGFPPRSVNPVSLAIDADIWDHRFRTFGFPQGRDDGVWATGVIRDEQATGWVQVNVVTETGYAVTPGFSGGPIWDEELTSVVGMTVVADVSPKVRTAYMISCKTIVEAWAELEPQPDKIARYDLRIVTAVMNSKEADQLFNDKAFIDDKMSANERESFLQFRESFGPNEIKNLSNSYKIRRRHWKPYLSVDETIHEIIVNTVSELNDLHSETANPRLFRPRFLSEGFFSIDVDSQYDTWDELTEDGCLIVVDAVSLFHPDLRQTLIQSHIASEPRAAVVVLSPVPHQTAIFTQRIDLAMQSWMQRAVDRFLQFDKHCEFGLTHPHSLKRWLFHSLPEITSKDIEDRLTPKNRRRFRSKMKMQPGGFGNLVARGKIEQ